MDYINNLRRTCIPRRNMCLLYAQLWTTGTPLSRNSTGERSYGLICPWEGLSLLSVLPSCSHVCVNGGGTRSCSCDQNAVLHLFYTLDNCRPKSQCSSPQMVLISCNATDFSGANLNGTRIGDRQGSPCWMT